MICRCEWYHSGTASEKTWKSACPVDDFEDHVCRIPWFVIQSELDDEDDEDTVRELPNR